MTDDLKSTHYIRVSTTNTTAFEKHLMMFETDFTMLSIDHSTGTVLYSVQLDGEEALSLKLSFPVVGFMNFSRTLTKRKKEDQS